MQAGGLTALFRLAWNLPAHVREEPSEARAHRDSGTYCRKSTELLLIYHARKGVAKTKEKHSLPQQQKRIHKSKISAHHQSYVGNLTCWERKFLETTSACSDVTQHGSGLQQTHRHNMFAKANDRDLAPWTSLRSNRCKLPRVPHQPAHTLHRQLWPNQIFPIPKYSQSTGCCSILHTAGCAFPFYLFCGHKKKKSVTSRTPTYGAPWKPNLTISFYNFISCPRWEH